MTEPCIKEAEIARIDERTQSMERKIDDMHKWIIGGNNDGVLSKIKSAKTQLTIQWGVMVILFGAIVWVLRS